MSQRPRFATALSAITLAAMASGCAAPMSKPYFGGRGDESKIGLALRAQSALQAKDYQWAIDLGERAVENSPRDAGFRGLLGNAYFAAGRFASAESAYRDALTLYAKQPEVVLKLALVLIAQGEKGQALGLLQEARSILDASNLGLALALAGDPNQAIEVLESAARVPGADARLRQNLALAHGLAGQWEAARTVAAQDLSPDLVDSRVQQWMALASPARSHDQVAALIGVSPAAGDPGQPVRLALNGAPERLAEPVPVPQPAPQPVAVAAAEPVQLPPVAAPAEYHPVAEPAPLPAFQPETVEVVPASAPFVEAPVAAPEPRKPIAEAKPAPVRRAALPRASGNANVVMQLGAYSSRERVSVAWNLLTKRYPALRGYSPLTARFDSRGGTVYRLSVKGFDSEREAIVRCGQLKSNGGNCFVRHVAGDSPVRFASR